MKLSVDEIKKITSGAIRIYEEDGWIHFNRMTDAEIRSSEERDRPIRPYATSGVRIDLDGDLEKVSFDYQIFPGSSRKFYAFDILKNNICVQHVYQNTNRAISSYSIDFKPGECKRFTLVFPNLTRMVIKNLCIEGKFKAHKYKKKVLVMGDSITQGYDAHFPMNSYINRLLREFDFECRSVAIGGDKFNETILDEKAKSYKADLLLVAYGTNDWAGDADIPGNGDLFFRKLRKMYPSKPLFVLGPIWRGDGDKGKTRYTFKKAGELIRTLAKKYNGTYIDAYPFVPHDNRFFSEDHLHPNDDGFAFFESNLSKKLRKLSPEIFTTSEFDFAKENK